MSEEELGDSQNIEYEEIKIDEPERPIEEGEYGGDSLGEKEDETGSESDFKTLVKELRPKLKNERLNELLKTSGVSRIFPDNFLDKFGITVAMLVMEQDTTKPFDFVDIINHTQDILSIGYEGRGIADLLEAFGAVKEDELNKLSQDLGL